MVVMSSQNVVNRKFSFGSGPKRAVDRINKYFRDSNSISRALHNLLDKFDGDEQTDCEKKQARDRLAKYCPESSKSDDVYEIGKTILLGKPADDLQSIKESFTRFSRLLNDCGAYYLLAARVDRDEKEAPVLFLEHVITLKPPTTKEKLMDILDIVPRYPAYNQKVKKPKKGMLECAECAKKESVENNKQKCYSSSRCLVCQNQLAFIPLLPLDVSHRLRKDTDGPSENNLSSSQKKHNTAMPGTSSVYRDLIKQFNMISRARNNARKRKQPPEAKRDTKRNRTGPGRERKNATEYMKSVRVKLSRVNI